MSKVTNLQKKKKNLIHLVSSSQINSFSVFQHCFCLTACDCCMISGPTLRFCLLLSEALFFIILDFMAVMLDNFMLKQSEKMHKFSSYNFSDVNILWFA